MSKELERELNYLEEDIKLCGITTLVRLNRFDKVSKEKPKEHLLHHIKLIRTALTPPNLDELKEEIIKLGKNVYIGEIRFTGDKYLIEIEFFGSMILPPDDEEKNGEIYVVIIDILNRYSLLLYVFLLYY